VVCFPKSRINENGGKFTYISLPIFQSQSLFHITGLNQAVYFLLFFLSILKGHIYCITECGGAMEEGNCPECGSRIGGHNHQLRSDNQLAREMDGAQYAAFSDMANIRNFDPRDFMI